LDLVFCITCLLEIRPLGTEIRIEGVSIGEEDWDIEQKLS
jgi:hypothetical protein